LRESLKRCSPGTMEAVLSYRNTGDTRAIPSVVMGIIERFLEPENRPIIKTGANNVRLVEDLGLDSLLMVEIIILVEEALDISIPNEEMRELRTVSDLKEFIDCKAVWARFRRPMRFQTNLLFSLNRRQKFSPTGPSSSPPINTISQP